MNTDRVELSSELSAFVAERIERYGAERTELQSWLAPYVEKHKILPLLVNWPETIGIMPDGAIRKFSADGEHSEYEGLRAVDEISHFLGALVQGARKYPELRCLIPPRPYGAITCGPCLGQGIFPQRPELVCQCGGVGWMVPLGEASDGDATKATPC